LRIKKSVSNRKGGEKGTVIKIQKVKI